MDVAKLGVMVEDWPTLEPTRKSAQDVWFFMLAVALAMLDGEDEETRARLMDEYGKPAGLEWPMRAWPEWDLHWALDYWNGSYSPGMRRTVAAMRKAPPLEVAAVLELIPSMLDISWNATNSVALAVARYSNDLAYRPLAPVPTDD